MSANAYTALVQRSTQVRQANKRVRHALADGRLTIADVMRDQATERNMTSSAAPRTPNTEDNSR